MKEDKKNIELMNRTIFKTFIEEPNRPGFELYDADGFHTCCICDEEDIPTTYIIPGCLKSPQICEKCWIKWVEAPPFS
jgi:hypothetical protein